MKDALGSVQSVLVLGATSDIAAATMRELVARRARRFVLAARRPDDARPLAEELVGRGADVAETIAFDAREVGDHERVAGEAFDRLGDIDLVLVTFGVLGADVGVSSTPEAVAEVLETNFVGAASIIVPIARRMTDQGHGTIVVLSSVAGERVRKSNFIYGASKAGLDGFAQGLGDTVAGTGVDVMIVRPGFVHTKMTAGRRAAPLSTTPEVVARAIVDGLARGSEIVWVPGALRVVMWALRQVPRRLWRRLPV